MLPGMQWRLETVLGYDDWREAWSWWAEMAHDVKLLLYKPLWPAGIQPKVIPALLLCAFSLVLLILLTLFIVAWWRQHRRKLCNRKRCISDTSSASTVTTSYPCRPLFEKLVARYTLPSGRNGRAKSTRPKSHTFSGIADLNRFREGANFRNVSLATPDTDVNDREQVKSQLQALLTAPVVDIFDGTKIECTFAKVWLKTILLWCSEFWSSESISCTMFWFMYPFSSSIYWFDAGDDIAWQFFEMVSIFLSDKHKLLFHVAHESWTR